MWMWHTQTVASRDILPNGIGFILVLVSQCVCVAMAFHLGFLTFPVLAFHVSVPSWFSFSSCFIREFLLFHDPLSAVTPLSPWLCAHLFLSLLHGCSICWWPVRVLPRLVSPVGLPSIAFERLKEFHSLFGLSLPNFHLLYFSLFYHHHA